MSVEWDEAFDYVAVSDAEHKTLLDVIYNKPLRLLLDARIALIEKEIINSDDFDEDTRLANIGLKQQRLQLLNLKTFLDAQEKKLKPKPQAAE